jgi:putative membrane protein
MEMFWYGSPGGWALGLGSVLFWVLLAVAIGALVQLFARGGRRLDPPYPGYADGLGPYGPAGPSPGHVVSPEQILAERFARGEIGQDEFFERMAAVSLRTPAPQPAPQPGPADAVAEPLRAEDERGA